MNWTVARWMGLGLLCMLVLWRLRPAPVRGLVIRSDRVSLPANGSSLAHVSVCDSASALLPKQEIEIAVRGGGFSLYTEQIRYEPPCWQVLVRAGVLPGQAVLAASGGNYPEARLTLTAQPDENDSEHDGTPDFLRLDVNDEARFRRWFTYLAEAEYFRAPATLPAEINDCAALIRFAYRETLRAHNSAWANGIGLQVLPGFPGVRKYQYPHTPLGANLFRVREGTFTKADLTSAAFAQFADAQTLRRLNTHFVTRDVRRARAGDLLFFRREQHRLPFHSMIYLGSSQLEKTAGPYVLYHTGPEGTHKGEMRRVPVRELMNFPQPEWRPESGNESFLGVYCWNILSEQRTP